MTRKSLARSLVFITVLVAIGSQATWLKTVDSVAGTTVAATRTGGELVPLLQALTALNLITVIGLFLLPVLVQRITLLLISVVGAMSGWLIVAWALENAWKVGTLSALIGAVLATGISLRGMVSLPSKVIPREKQPDMWRALDEGIDPTLDE